MPENNSLAEQGQHASGPINLDIRFVVDLPHFVTFSSLISFSEDNTQDDSRQQRPMPLGVALTGNILFTMSWIVGLGVPKAVYSYNGQSLISPTLDWVAGVIFTLM